MHYPDGEEIRVGDVIAVDRKLHGTVVGCIDTAQYREPQVAAQWHNLRSGVIVDTKFGGLVHYPDQHAIDAEEFFLVNRSA
jgi:hypothetical protein